jgi:hypothetical protein
MLARVAPLIVYTSRRDHARRFAAWSARSEASLESATQRSHMETPTLGQRSSRKSYVAVALPSARAIGRACA